VDLPDNVKALLAGSGSALKGKTVVVTGVPPTIGRKTAETLVQQYGGKLTKSLSKNTNYVVIGGDAGPKK
jgi:BRCT domain type II-containing protein